MDSSRTHAGKARRQRTAWLLALALIGAGAIAAPAAAQTGEVDLGPGELPSVALDSDDTAHVVWNGTENANASLIYCRLPQGATACSPRLTLPSSGESLQRPQVFAGRSGPVRILSYRYGLSPGSFQRIFQYTSSDTGQSFSGPQPVGFVPMDDASPGPDGAILTSGQHASRPAFQRVQTDGSNADAFAHFPNEQNFATIGAVGMAGMLPVGIFESATAIAFRRWSGTGDVHDPATWTPLKKIADETYPRLAPGPKGLFLLSSAPDALRAYSYVSGEPGEFHHEGDIQGSERIGANSHMVQSSGGNLHAVYVNADASGYSIYEATSGTGKYWTRRLVRDAGPLQVKQPRVATGEEGSLLATWIEVKDGSDRVKLRRLFTKPPPAPVPNLRATGIEVTQGIQTREEGFNGGELPSSRDAFGKPFAGRPRYRGVKLAEESKTVVRLFANTQSGSVKNVLARLYGYRDGKPLPGGPLHPENGRRDLTSSHCNCALPADREDQNGSYYFTLPDSWTRGRIDLRGEVSRLSVKSRTMVPTGRVRLPSARSSTIEKPALICGTSACLKDDKFELMGIPFTRTARIFISPLRMLLEGQVGPDALPAAYSVFDDAVKLHPGGERYVVLPYVTDLDLKTEGKAKATDPECKDRKDPADCRNSLFYNRVYQWAVRHPVDTDLHIGVNTQERGAANDSIYNLPPGRYDPSVPNEHGGAPAGFVKTSRPITSVAHELGHLLGRVHAGPKCGGGGQPWPPDDSGFMNGVALDRHDLITKWGMNKPYNVFAAGIRGQPAQWYDLMSYCASTDELDNPDAWISPRGWDEELAALHRYGKRVGFNRTTPKPVAIPFDSPDAVDSARGAAAAPKTLLDVTASADETGVRVENVARTLVASPKAGSSDITLVGRNAAGAVVATAPMAVSSAFVHGGGFASLRAAIPAAGLVAVEVVRGGQVLASRRASAKAPTVRVTSPRRGARVPGKGSADVRWAAADADGDPLTATALYSRDDGRSWRTVGIGPNDGRATLPVSYFSGSRAARVMVIASDGFHETAAVSGRFRAVGVPPRVRVLSPLTRSRVSSASTLLLSGQGVDDALRLLVGRRLQWYDGRRLLGRGERVAVRGLRPGLRQIRLVGVDGSGRRGSASVRVRVLATPPAFASLRVPERISRKAKSMAIGVSTNVAGRLTTYVGRSRPTFSVGPKLKTLRLKVKPGRAKLTLGLRLRAGGREVQTAVDVRRR
jgi:hypothetical protein